jgi:NADH dehydrogenase
LGKGDFFGETALLGNRPHETSIRARTAVRLRQAGSALFSQIAGTFAPFREVLSQKVIRGSGDFWNRLPQARSLLEREPLASLLDPLPTEFLHKDTTLAAAIRVLKESPAGELLVLDETQHLWRTLDRNDLHQIVARIAVIPPDKRRDITQRKLTDFLVENPLYVTLEDSTLVAYTTILDHGISWLPVVQNKEDPKPVGCLRGDKIASRVIQQIGQMETLHAQVGKQICGQAVQQKSLA